MSASSNTLRLRLLDALRGFSVLSMVAFHTVYDLVYLYGITMPWFLGPFQEVWRSSISWTFLLIAGWMCNHSRNNLTRAAKYLAVALGIFAVTSIAKVDTPISFGIIFCMGASTLFYAAGKRFAPRLFKPSSEKASAILFCVLVLLFLFSRGVPSGTVGLFGWQFPLPAWPYDCGWLSWLGFPSPTFMSGDYYPLIPFSLLFLAGSHLGNVLPRHERVLEFLSYGCKPLELVGRYALPIYVLHQPLVLVVLQLALGT